MSTFQEVRAAYSGVLLTLSHFDELAKMSKSERRKWAAEHREKALGMAIPIVIDLSVVGARGYFVQSRSNPWKFHTVTKIACNCYRFQTKGSCYHHDLISEGINKKSLDGKAASKDK